MSQDLGQKEDDDDGQRRRSGDNDNDYVWIIFIDTNGTIN